MSFESKMWKSYFSFIEAKVRIYQFAPGLKGLHLTTLHAPRPFSTSPAGGDGGDSGGSDGDGGGGGGSGCSSS